MDMFYFRLCKELIDICDMDTLYQAKKISDDRYAIWYFDDDECIYKYTQYTAWEVENNIKDNVWLFVDEYFGDRD